MVVKEVNLEPMNELNSNGNKRGMHPNSKANLKPNLSGRPPKDISLTSHVKQELTRIPTIEEDGFDGKGKSNAYWIARMAVIEARSGDKSARMEIWERIEGKVTQPIGGEDGQPVKVEITVSSETAKKLTEQIIKGENT